MPTSKAQIAEALVKAEVLRHGVFTLKSGARSPIYVDLRVVPSVPEAMDSITDGLALLCAQGAASKCRQVNAAPSGKPSSMNLIAAHFE